MKNADIRADIESFIQFATMVEAHAKRKGCPINDRRKYEDAATAALHFLDKLK